MVSTKRGAFIVIEGLDRSGKSTQAASLLSRLEASNVPAKLIKFPDRTTPIGQMIDSYLRSESDVDDRAIHLLFSANRWEQASRIEQTLNSGTTIICDRYAFSGVAFSASKQLQQPDPPPDSPPPLPLSWYRAPDSGLPAPDLTLFLDISPEAAQQRGGYGQERYETAELQRRVRHVFASIAADVQHRDPDRDLNHDHDHDYDYDYDYDYEGGSTKWVTINAGRPLEDVKNDIWTEVDRLLAGAELAPIRRLWLSPTESTESTGST